MIDWNTVKYVDCMDEKEGLPSLPDKSFDLGMADPPWNINYDGAVGSTGKKTGEGKWKKQDYNDTIENYENFTLNWFTQIERICKRTVIAPGRQNLKLWYPI